jgi:hypothetical protein
VRAVGGGAWPAAARVAAAQGGGLADAKPNRARVLGLPRSFHQNEARDAAKLTRA